MDLTIDTFITYLLRKGFLSLHSMDISIDTFITYLPDLAAATL